ncbi:hypothetical protein BHM03_00026504, partial [Ensete ventricosum]
IASNGYRIPYCPIPTSEPSKRVSQMGSTVRMLNSDVFTRIPSVPCSINYGPRGGWAGDRTPNHHLQASLLRDPAGMETRECYLRIEAMAFNQTTNIALSVLFLGSVSFVFGIVAENKKVCLAYKAACCFRIFYFGYQSRNVHHDLTTQCPTAKTGLFGGGAFLALDAAIFWLICQMLTMNSRSDYFDEDDLIGEYGEVNCVTDVETIAIRHPTA